MAAILRCIARLDYDSRDELEEGVRRMRFLRSLPCIDAERFNMSRYRTRRGWHVEIYSNMELAPAEIVALQAILGSDFRRESFNLYRAHKLPLTPLFWRRLSRWNVLHKPERLHNEKAEGSKRNGARARGRR
jgi:hypothetical protein